VNANNAATNANTNIRLQLSLLPNPKPCLLAKNKSTHASFGSSSEEDGNLKQKMKRINNLFDKIVSSENLMLAEQKARKGKLKSRGVVLFDRDPETKLSDLHALMISGDYKTSEYHTFNIVTPEGKEREIFRLPYYPDRIVHHAIMNVMEEIWVNIMTANTYSCIKKRGIHKAAKDVKETLTKFPDETTYCLKLDVRKFYPTIDHDILKSILRKKIKDKRLLYLLDEIIDSAPGVPIGNYLSQYFANLYLTYFDHWLKESKKVSHYYRYADDMVILHSSKEYLHGLLSEIKNYLQSELKLTVKNNHRIFPVNNGIDFVGYVFYPTHTRLRKTIKKRFAKAVSRNKNDLRTVHSAYFGWAKHCNSINLLKKLSA